MPNVVEKVEGQVRVRHVLCSVSDKTGLEILIPQLIEICQGVKILSTGGTFARIAEILGKELAEKHLVQVAKYTGQPETQGGLVKTLDFKIYLGLLTETYNDAHQEDLARTEAVPIDMVVVNLYPFAQTVAQEGITPEQARGQIDIGGPTMIRAAAKNFIRVASIVDPSSYPEIIQDLKENKGKTSFDLRFMLMRKAFAHTAEYDKAISTYWEKISITEAAKCYRIMGHH